jgi:thiol-disulfide isomerase/thioredoxin
VALARLLEYLASAFAVMQRKLCFIGPGMFCHRWTGPERNVTDAKRPRTLRSQARLRSCAESVARNDVETNISASEESHRNATSEGAGTEAKPAVSQSERMAKLLGRNVEDDRKAQKEQSRVLKEEFVTKQRDNRRASIAAVFVGVAASLLSHVNPFDPSAVLQHLEERSAPITVIGNGKPTLLDVYAEWCTNCKAMASGLYDLELSELGQNVNFITLNADNPKIADLLERFEVDGVPHFALLDKSGQVRATFVGNIPVRVLEDDLAALSEGQERLPYPGIDYSELLGGKSR